MIELTKSQITSKVRAALDEISENDSGFNSGQDEAELDTIIAEKALEAINFVNGNASADLLEPDGYRRSTDDGASAFFTEVEKAGQIVGRFVLPNKFLRIVYAGYSNWDHMVNTYLLSTEKDSAKLSNKYTTGTKNRPVVLVQFSHDATDNAIPVGSKLAYLYSRCRKPAPTSSSTGAQLQQSLATLGEQAEAVMAYMLYVNSWGTDNKISVSQNLCDAFIYYLTGLVLTVLNDERQRLMYDQAALLMGIHKSTEGQ